MPPWGDSPSPSNTPDRKDDAFHEEGGGDVLYFDRPLTRFGTPWDWSPKWSPTSDYGWGLPGRGGDCTSVFVSKFNTRQD